MKKEEYILQKHFKKKPRKDLLHNIGVVCETLTQAGEKYSVRKVRLILKKGSHTTISKYIDLWKAKKYDELASVPIAQEEHLSKLKSGKFLESNKTSFDWKNPVLKTTE